jgi:7,8-dihydroneopterin 2',3'-cyclic phosphate phosphodiesterase
VTEELHLRDELDRLIGMISDEGLREKVVSLLEDPDIELEGAMLGFDKAPGGAYVHHAYQGGLLEHTVAMTHICLTMCDLVETIYGGEVDRDVVLAGALVHDVMKCYAYSRVDGGFFRTSALGERVDHLTLLVSELLKRGFSLEVVHVVASHHGDQSPVKPKTLEALIVSIADLADSEFSRKSLRAAEHLVRETTGRRKRFGSSREALELLGLKAREGWEGVHRYNSGKDK